MLIVLFLILLLTVGGLSLTYLFDDDQSLLWRIAAGNVIGTIIFGLIGFVLAEFFDLNAATIFAAAALSVAPAVLLNSENIRARFFADWLAAKNNLNGATFKSFFRFGYYIFFIVLFWFFFDRAMLVTKDGIFTGGSQNLGDLPFHLGAIFSFTDGNNFAPPQNPSFAGAKFSYPFIADFIAACFVKFGASVREAMFAQNITLAFSLLVVLEKFAYKLTNNRLAGKIAPVLLFFCGGLGFLWFFNDVRHDAKGFFDLIFHLPQDYTIGEKFRWGNSLITLFMTQRSLLLGMPLTIIVLTKLWRIFATEDTENTEESVKNIKDIEDDLPDAEKSSDKQFPFSTFFVGLLAGTLPLVHAHSLFVLFVVAAFLFFFRFDQLREWIAFGLGVFVVALPELLWIMSGSATQTSEFVSLFFGWDKRADNFFWFWLKNLGIFIPVLLIGLFYIFSKTRDKQKIEAVPNDAKPEKNSSLILHPSSLILFYLPFACLFVVSNTFKLAPWEWDNIKVLIYWFVGSVPFVAYILARLWTKNYSLKIVAAACLLMLTAAGALDVWRVVSEQINYGVFDKDAIAIAEQIKQKTAPKALFLNAPTYNTAIVLSGRRSLMRYTGHLSSYGIDYGGREKDVQKIYAGDATAAIFMRKYGIEYVLISPEETNSMSVNADFFRQFPVIAEAGQYRVYQVGSAVR